LANAFRKRGHAVLTDDLCIVRPGVLGRMLAFPGVPQTKLWMDSLRQLGLPADGLGRVRRAIEKRSLRLSDDFHAGPLPVRTLYALDDHNVDGCELQHVHGADRLTILKRQTYRFGFLPDGALKANHFRHALQLAQHATVATLRRPSGSFQLDALVQLID